MSDYSGSNWVTAFNEDAEKILQCSSKEIGESIDNRDETHKVYPISLKKKTNNCLFFQEFFTAIGFKKFQMKFRAKMESYNDESRLKINVVQADPVDYKSYARRLLTDFKAVEGIRTGH